MQVVPETGDPDGQVAELEKRCAALRQAASLPGADLISINEAVLTELECAIGMLAALEAGTGPAGGRSAEGDGSERRLLRAAFTEVPVPLFLLGRDGTVLRVNKSAGQLLGSKPGYATGRPFTAFVALPARATVKTQLTAVARSGNVARVKCGLLSSLGAAVRELTIGLIKVAGEADRLVVAISDGAGEAATTQGAAGSGGADPGGAESDGAGSSGADPGGAESDGAGSGGGGSGGVESGGAGPGAADLSGEDSAGADSTGADSGTATAKLASVDAGPEDAAGAVQALTQRMDLATALSRLMLENENFSESMTLQRSARLLADELSAWVIVDLDRRGLLVRQFVVGPEGPGLAEVSDLAASVNPTPGSLPHGVHDSGQGVLIAHADDAEILGPGPGDTPLLMLLGTTSVLSVPIADGDSRYGVLTLARQAGSSHFEIADLGLVEEVGEQLALAVRVDQLVRRRIEIADALQASLLPRRLPEIPGVELASAYIAATEGIEIGADFYDAYRTPEGWGLSVGDVCGKGEEAAAVTAAARHAIRIFAHQVADPVAVLTGANEIMLAAELSGGFVTASVAHLRWQKGGLRALLGSAGHPSAAVIRQDGRVQMPGGGGVPLGLFPDLQPGLNEVIMREGDALFLYTDGLTQARGLDGTYFQARLADELAGLAGQRPNQLAGAMRRRVLEFTAGHLIDDITMMVMQVGTHPDRAPRKR